MHFKFRNVNDAFKGMVEFFNDPGNVTRKTSRNGDVLMIEEPVIITYSNPKERVLFNQARDANPFFHLYEALWMLAGRNDIAPLKYYVSTIDQFSDDGKTFNGAYGYRWRSDYYSYRDPKLSESEYYGHSCGPVDQLKILIEHLKAQPNSRRAVLQMWNVEDDLLKIDSSKDVCCNLSACFSLREVKEHLDDGVGRAYQPYNVLDMTVFNRSNDLIWGCLGANVVHFSILQEYIAAHLGVEVGVYNQVTNNLHVYTNNWKPEEWLRSDWLRTPVVNSDIESNIYYSYAEPKLCPLVKDPKVFDEEVWDFVQLNYPKEGTNPEVWIDNLREDLYDDQFLSCVAKPMMLAYHSHKLGNHGAAGFYLREIEADDWRIAATNWIERRLAKRANSST